MLSSPIDRIERARAEKRELRRHFRALRHAITPEDKATWDRAICEHLLSLPCIQEANILLAYHPIGDEPDLRPVVRWALTKKITVAFPVCDPQTSTMVFRAVHSLDELYGGSYGIFEPTEQCPMLTDFDGAICLVPALSFDRQGFRIGYGKGYYDRFLAAHPTQAVGATYHALITDSLPCEPTDRAVSILITERGILLPDETKRT